MRWLWLGTVQLRRRRLLPHFHEIPRKWVDSLIRLPTRVRVSWADDERGVGAMVGSAMVPALVARRVRPC